MRPGQKRRLISACAVQTNNPRKIVVLEELGVVVTERIPCIVKAQEHNMGYLATKQVGFNRYFFLHARNPACVLQHEMTMHACCSVRTTYMHAAKGPKFACMLHIICTHLKMLSKQNVISSALKHFHQVFRSLLLHLCFSEGLWPRNWSRRNAEAGVIHVQARMSHWMEEGADSLDGSYCYWNHDGEPLKPSATKGQQPPPHSNGRLIGRP